MNIVHCSKARPAKFWHRVAIFFQGLFAPKYAFILTSKGTGFLYSPSDKNLAPSTINHEAEHLRQSIAEGDFLFRLKWVFNRRSRMVFEAEGYSHQLATPQGVLDAIRERASVYWLGKITDDDGALILKVAGATQKRGAPQFTYKDKR